MPYFANNNGPEREAEEDEGGGLQRNPGAAQMQTAQPGTPNQGNGAGTSYQDFLSGGQQGPTQTGYLNFDYFGQANQDVAKREAKRVNEGVANQAKKAKTGVQGVNQRYLDALNGTGAGFDEQGNYLGGAAGPQFAGGVPLTPGGTVDLAPAAPGEATPASGMPADYRAFLEQQAATARDGADGVPDFTDTEGYDEAGKDVREADRQLNALGDEAGLAELSGGNWADAALLSGAGRPAFAETRDYYGKKGTGHDSMGDFANAVADNATRMGQGRRNELNARASEYEAALGAYDEQRRAAKGEEPGAPPVKRTWHDDIDDFTKGLAPEHAEGDAQSRGWAADITKYPAGQQIASEYGLTPQQAQQKWNEFRNALPERARDYLDAMLAYLETHGNEPNLSGKEWAEGDKLNTDAQKVQALFRAWLADNGTTETQTSGGLTSTETRHG